MRQGKQILRILTNSFSYQEGCPRQESRQEGRQEDRCQEARQGKEEGCPQEEGRRQEGKEVIRLRNPNWYEKIMTGVV